MLEPGKAKVAVGRIIKTHGIKGELNVELTDFAEPDEDFAPGACLILEIEGLDVPFFVAASRPRGNGALLLTLDDVSDEQAAAQLVGKSLYVYVSREEAEELTAGELLGYVIVDNADGKPVGRIAQLEELTSGSWFFRLDDGRLIPAVDDLILAVHPEAQTLEMDLPQGILDL